MELCWRMIVKMQLSEYQSILPESAGMMILVKQTQKGQGHTESVAKWEQTQVFFLQVQFPVD